MKVNVPPIKSQGIKTKLIPWIAEYIPSDFSGTWIEPFMGTGAVAFNIAPKKAILCDNNPHLINFYQAISQGDISAAIVKEFLTKEGKLLQEKGEQYYYYIRDRFNKEQSPLDFLFLNRASFNGMIRFNRKGEFNVPFCRKENRFAQAYITKIVNQIHFVENILKVKNFKFICQDFRSTISLAKEQDIIYCDPPYIDRHVDYFNSWNGNDENDLFIALRESEASFLLSTWDHNDYRKNDYIDKLWKKFKIKNREHFYHIGAKEKNRNPMIEAIVSNFSLTKNRKIFRW
ncbi:DNA adenine methylase [Aggregatibacter actinomycetemcomitans]|uniref:DNA adenine methylase n=1 Tax=Aggregatibacter actinomycetemcomitans TaxID=714 RepID=UPI00023FF9B3|nr:Dam family site-specific DNA-(adenine-N6)-methyltransferase [Aggregatibacter actinomycetemcomitans]EHK90723.1 DNA adenine methylase [Aggregatibacter actinomycetemcomitans RhAA1]KNE77771.1 DNA adenine methylase [Aggregatibacter actinomycetemcomitans RhAA1]MBN6079825.1 Dam family site-specific DNA-(adenine-N6)-methyltransferase [Aggregatibacter actinomycetemcomitans]